MMKNSGGAPVGANADVTASSTCASVTFSPVMFVTPLPFCTKPSVGVFPTQPFTRTMSLMS